MLLLKSATTAYLCMKDMTSKHMEYYVNKPIIGHIHLSQKKIIHKNFCQAVQKHQ